MEKRFIATNTLPSVSEFSCRWQAPSNIALVKYWGKTALQLPKNASLSFTLSQAITQTEVQFTRLESSTENVQFSIFFEGKASLDFRPKLETFFKRILPYQPFLAHYQLVINSQNTFPHSSGIASSASSMAALAACLVDFEAQLAYLTEAEKQSKISFLARLGSGSACRSVVGPVMAWGKHSDIATTSNLLAVEVPKIHPVFSTFHDTILLIDKGQKQVSSTLGHKLMENHPYAEQRFAQADAHLGQLLPILQQGDVEAFIPIVEKEALHLHAMMMTSDPYFILMHPNTLKAIESIWKFRKSTRVPVCFTLDAGANVHILYPNVVADQVKQFIDSELLQYCENRQCVHDTVGTGIKKY
jgi:diphosphomevalonate decarboxylase